MPLKAKLSYLINTSSSFLIVEFRLSVLPQTPLKSLPNKHIRAHSSLELFRSIYCSNLVERCVVSPPALFIKLLKTEETLYL